MGAPSDHILIAAVNQIRTNLLALGRYSGNRKDYRGVRLWMYDYPIEADLTLPWIQMEIGDASLELESNTLMRERRMLYLRVHVMGQTLNDGEIDVNTATLQVMADLHECMMNDRSQGSSVLNTEYSPNDCSWERFMANGAIPGVTLTEAYVLEYHWETGDMSERP